MNARQAMAGASRYVDVPCMPLRTCCAAPRVAVASATRGVPSAADVRVTKRDGLRRRVCMEAV